MRLQRVNRVVCEWLILRVLTGAVNCGAGGECGISGGGGKVGAVAGVEDRTRRVNH